MIFIKVLLQIKNNKMLIKSKKTYQSKKCNKKDKNLFKELIYQKIMILLNLYIINYIIQMFNKVSKLNLIHKHIVKEQLNIQEIHMDL